MTERAYLDWNATAPLRVEAQRALQEALAVTGNPSSVHAEGRAARRLIERAREEVAALVNARPADVIFTSSGTEANMLALTPALETAGEKQPRDRLFMSAIEHASVRTGGRFPRDVVTEVAVDAQGRIDLAALADALSAAARPLVSVMLANNETGVIQPVAGAATIVHAAGGWLHVDAVQAAGRLACDIGALGADILTLSAHKIGGPKGVGALVRGREDIHFPDPLIRGGGQERGTARRHRKRSRHRGLRSGGSGRSPAARQRSRPYAVAAEPRWRRACERLRRMSLIFGADAERLPNTTLFSVAGIKAETAVIAFDLEGIAVSSGAACSSGKVQPSHVLAAMGVSPALTARRGARQPWLDHHESRHRTLPRRLEKARNCII